MAETGWRRIDSYGSGEVQANEYFDSITRSNNTITINGLRSQWRVTVSGNDTNVWTRTYFNGVERQYTHYGNPSWAAWNIRYGNQAWFSINVGANDTTAYTSTSWGDFSGAWNNGNATFNIPALGAPAGTTYINSRTDTSINVRNDVTNWGSNATAGSVRSYRADNSGFSSQTYLSTTDNANINHTGLLPNKQYWFRGWADNGGGKSSYMSTVNAVTLSNATETSKTVLATTVSFVLAAVQGVRSTTSKVQYRKTGDATWLDSTTDAGATPTVSISGLLPNTQYDYRLAVTTSDGTWEGATQTLTTLPAGKLVMPNGDVKNAITRLVRPDGSVEMVNINLVDS